MLAREAGDDGVEIMGSKGYLVNSGIGWHEARVPTIATSVPRGAFTWVTQKLRTELRTAGLSIPVIPSNRLNMPRSPNRRWRTAAPTW
ncbi:2,4-dienoyl-CoA reductase [NADPH] [Polaromonas sp. CG9_12]|nr:hypothetical protein [Polaromonas sp. CG_9.11]CDS54541.1 2,4-dienoyl-CoA reductase [NADPH] [Polaromonas sp. CG9_12]